MHLVQRTTLESSEDDDDVRVMGLAGTQTAENELTLVAADSTGTVWIWKYPSNNIFESESLPEIEAAVALSVATNGEEFFIGSTNGFIVTIDANGRRLNSFRPHQSGVNALVSAGKFLVSVGDDQSIIVSRDSKIDMSKSWHQSVV